MRCESSAARRRASPSPRCPGQDVHRARHARRRGRSQRVAHHRRPHRARESQAAAAPRHVRDGRAAGRRRQRRRFWPCRSRRCSASATAGACSCPKTHGRLRDAARSAAGATSAARSRCCRASPPARPSSSRRVPAEGGGREAPTPATTTTEAAMIARIIRTSLRTPLDHARCWSRRAPRSARSGCRTCGATCFPTSRRRSST